MLLFLRLGGGWLGWWLDQLGIMQTKPNFSGVGAELGNVFISIFFPVFDICLPLDDAILDVLNLVKVRWRIENYKLLLL